MSEVVKCESFYSNIWLRFCYEYETTFESAESPRQVVDREKIEQKISELPDGIRDILEDKFKADFVSIEKIDEDKLIW